MHSAGRATRARLLPLLALLLALTGCEFRFEVDLNDDESGRFTFVMAIEKEFIALAELGGQKNPLDPEQLRKDVPAGIEVERYRTEKLEGVRLTIPFDSIAHLRRQAEELARRSERAFPGAAGGDGISTGLEDLSLERKPEGGWRFRLASRRAPGLALGEDDLPFDPQQLAELLDVQLRVRLPGAPVRHNADDVERGGGKTLFVWKPDPTSREPVTLIAETSPGGRSFPVVPLAAGLGGAALIGGAALWLMRRRIATLPTAAPSPEPAGRAPGAPPPEPDPGDARPPEHGGD